MILSAVAQSRRRVTPREAELLAVTGQLLTEHDDLPVGAVVHAIREARTELRLAGVVAPPPVLVGARARGVLRAAS